MYKIQIDFHNVLFIRSYDLPFEDHIPKPMSNGGICEHGFYFHAIKGNYPFILNSDIIDIQYCPVGSMFSFHDIVYSTIAIQRSEDPNDGIGLVHTIMNYKTLDVLNSETNTTKNLMNFQIADGMKTFFNKVICHEKTKQEKKDLHRFLRKEHEKTVVTGTYWSVL